MLVGLDDDDGERWKLSKAKRGRGFIEDRGEYVGTLRSSEGELPDEIDSH
jgi:hypothetical protein